MKRIISLMLIGITVILLAGCSAATTEKESLKFKETLGGYALYRYKGDSKKTSFTVPDEYKGQPVVEIMDFALANAEYLKSITIGASIEKVGDWAFTNCGALKKYIVEENSKYFTAVDGVLYKKDMTELISFPNGKSPLQYDSNKLLTGGSEIVIPQS
ncbi:MAG: leucine-rich repeat protein, partial [Eubacteriales bacterium]